MRPATQTDMASHVHHTTEQDVVVWRRGRLRRAGFDPALATALADDCGFDLHALLGLVDRGCPPHLAARILAPLEEDRRPC